MKNSEMIMNEVKALNARLDEIREEYVEKYGFWNFIEPMAKDSEYKSISRRIPDLEAKARIEARKEVEVGDGVTVHYFSDAHACTVIKKTKTTITIRRDKATLDPNFKPEWVAGGFAGHCTNQEDQTYTYEPDENGATYVCHWSESQGCYRAQGCLMVTNGRREFYDYNF